jgi:hypothetical protein
VVSKSTLTSELAAPEEKNADHRANNSCVCGGLSSPSEGLAGQSHDSFRVQKETVLLAVSATNSASCARLRRTSTLGNPLNDDHICSEIVTNIVKIAPEVNGSPTPIKTITILFINNILNLGIHCCSEIVTKLHEHHFWSSNYDK